MSTIKSIGGVAIADMKSRNGIVRSAIKTIKGADVPAGGGGSSLLTDLVEWWPLDESSGTRAGAHASLDLTDNNTVTGAAGPAGTLASQFTRANSEYLSRASESALQVGDIDFTFCCWVYMNSKPSGDFNTFIGKFELTSPANSGEFAVDYYNVTDRFRISLNSTGLGAGPYGTAEANNLGSPSLSTWYFIVAWHDATANTVNIQVNNGTADSVSYSSGVYVGTAPFQIGRLGPSITRYCDGRINRAGFWKRVLTSDERTELYNGGAGIVYPFSEPFGGLVDTTGLVDWWPLSESSGSRVGVHAGLDLTDNNTVTGGNDGVAYSQFTAANSEYLNRTSEAALQIGSSSFSVCAWAYLDSTANGRCVAGKWLTNQFEWVLQFRGPATNRVDFYVATGITTPDTGNFATVALTASTATWYFVCAWYDSTGGTVNISINDGTPGSTAKGAVSSSGSAAFTIGRNDDAGAASPAYFYWNGRIRRVGFWKRVLTGSEITALYNSGNGLDY